MTKLSVDDVAPDEEGGPIARIGFNYQDEIAVSFLLEMIESPTLLKVHCETHDDIVLVCDDGFEGQVAEFVQVKGNELDKLWSIADISQRKQAKSKEIELVGDSENNSITKAPKGREGTSIFETSLGRDKLAEKSKFRIITLRDVDNDLKILTYNLGVPGREKTCKEYIALHSKIIDRFPNLKSGNKNGVDYWIDNCYWDVRHSEAAVRKSNRLRIVLLCISRGVLPDQADVLLEELRLMAKNAGAAKWKTSKGEKIITKKFLVDWFEKRLDEIILGAKNAPGLNLKRKLVDAKLKDLVLNADDIRRDYTESRLNPRYMAADDRESLQQTARSELITLHSDFLASADDNSVNFHAACVKQMDEISKRPESGNEDVSAYLKGFMYEVVDRCRLRFNKPAL